MLKLMLKPEVAEKEAGGVVNVAAEVVVEEVEATEEVAGKVRKISFIVRIQFIQNARDSSCNYDFIRGIQIFSFQSKSFRLGFSISSC